MAYLRVRRQRRGYAEIGRKIRFLKRVEFVQGQGLALERSETFHVDGKDGSDTYNGLSMDRAKATIEAAITEMNNRISWSESPWARSDILYIAPGLYAENLTALPYGSSIIGLGDAFDINGERGVTIKPAAGSPVDVTSAINSLLSNICFMAPDTSVIFQADNFNRNIMEHCVFAGLPGASPTTTKGFEVVKDMTGSKLLDCHFIQIRNAIYLVADNANQKQITGDLFEDIFITGGDQKGIFFHANCVPSNTIINRANIGGGGATLALAIDDDTGIVHIYNSNFQATACDPASGDGDSKYNNCYLNGGLIT